MSNVAAGKDTDDEGESLNDVEKTLKRMNIQLRSSVGEWRNFEDVLEEVAEKWNNGAFNEVEKSQIATAIAGVRQQENFRALMNNWNEVTRLTGVAADSTGSATERMEVYLDSIEAKTNQLKATWEEFIMNLNQSESWKNFLDLGIWMLENFPTVITLLTTIIALIKAKAITTGIVTLIQGFSKFGTVMSTLGVHITNFKRGFVLIPRLLSGAKMSAKATTAAFNALSTSISAVISVIGIALVVYQQLQQAEEERIAQNREKIAAAKEETESIKQLSEEYKNIISSTEDSKTKKQNLLAVQNELIASYGDEAKNIDLVNGSYTNQLELLEKLQKKKLQEEQQAYQQGAKDRDARLATRTVNILSHNKDGISSQLEREIGNIVYENGGYLSTTNGGGLRVDATAASIIKITNALKEYQQQLNEMGRTSDAQALAKMFDTSSLFKNSMQKDYDKFLEDYNEAQQAQYNSFLIDNFGAISEYEAILKQRQDLKEKYDNANSSTERKLIASNIKSLQDEYERAYKNIYENGKGINEDIKKMLDDAFGAFESDFKEIDVNWADLGLTDSKVKKELSEIANELKTTGELSEESKDKVMDLFKLVYSTGNETWIEAFRLELEKLGITVDDLEAKLNFDKIKETATTDDEDLQTKRDALETAKNDKTSAENRLTEAEENAEDAYIGSGDLKIHKDYSYFGSPWDSPLGQTIIDAFGRRN